MRKICILFIIGMMTTLFSCKDVKTDLSYENPDTKILFLHHSTGKNVWYGDVKQDKRIRLKEEVAMVPRLLSEYNEKSGSKIAISERYFPSGDPYKWKNYPFDYYNIWVKNAGDKPYMEEPTLEILTRDYNMIVFKHCFPGSSILADDEIPDINSEKKTLANYKLQYGAIKEKLNEFPDTKFIVWTPAALVEAETNEDEAKRAIQFVDWLKEEWDQEGDNVFLFDFREIETEGGLYLKPEFANSNYDSHPNLKISAIAAKHFVDFIVEVVEN